MSENKPTLTEFERAVLERLADGDHPVLSALRAQLRACLVVGRKFTGHGFLTQLNPDRSVRPAPVSRDRFHIWGVGAHIRGLERGAGFVLFLVDGYMDVLEGFSYDEAWPENVSEYTLFYEGPRKRDLAAIGLAGGEGESLAAQPDTV